MIKIRKIGIVATSASAAELNPEVVQKGIAFFTKKNIEVVFAPNVFKDQGHTAGTIAERIDCLEAFLEDPSIDLVMSFWGGHQTHQLVPHFSAEQKSMISKPFSGYSDLTPLLNTFAEKGKLNPILGPAFITFCKPIVFDYTWESLLRTLSGERFVMRPSSEYSTNRWYEDGEMKRTPSQGWKILKPGQCQGLAVGGNMGSLLLLAGTPYWPNFRSKVLFLEEDESESVETLDRFLTHLQQTGVFDLVSGVAFGRFMDRVIELEDFEKLLNRVFKSYTKPVIYEVDFGHSDPLLSIPLGREVELMARSSDSVTIGVRC